MGTGRESRISLPVNGDGHPDDLEGCSMQVFLLYQEFVCLPSHQVLPQLYRQKERVSSHCRKTKLTAEKLSGVRHLWLRHREGENLVCAICGDTLFWRTNRKKTFQTFAEKAKTSEHTLAVQFPPKTNNGK